MNLEESKNKLKERGVRVFYVSPKALRSEDILVVGVEGPLTYANLADVADVFGTDRIDIGADGLGTSTFGVETWVELTVYL